MSFLRLLPALSLLRHELRIVAIVKEDHAVKFFVLYDGPTSALRWVHFVVAVPGPCNGCFTVSCRQAAVHLPVDVAEVELSVALLVELEIAFFLFVNELLVPC